MISGAIGMRRHVDHAQPGLAQQHQQEQEPLLHGLGHAAARRHGPVEGDRRDDDHRLVVVVEPHRLPDLGHPGLQRVEAPVPLLLDKADSTSGPASGGVHRSPVMTRSARCRRP